METGSLHVMKAPRCYAIVPSILLLAILSLAAFGTSPVSVSAAATPPPKTHYWVNACKVKLPFPGVGIRAGHALRARIIRRRHNSVLGFSECLFISKRGEFVLLDLASSFMLSRHAGHTVTAAQEFNRIDRLGGFPPALQYINRKRTQFLHSDRWQIGYRDDVIGLATFGFYHRVLGTIPTFPYATTRLYIFLNDRVMPTF